MVSSSSVVGYVGLCYIAFDTSDYLIGSLEFRVHKTNIYLLYNIHF